MKQLNVTGMILTLSLLVACGEGGGAPQNTQSGPQTVSMRAKISSNQSMNALAGGIDPLRIKKAVVLSMHSKPEVVELTDGALQTELPRHSAAALFFIDENDQYVGYLSLKDGIDVLPTTKIDESVSQIDLGELIANGDSLVPAVDPFENEIPMSALEQSVLAQNDDYMAAMIKNADSNGDGVLDALTSDYYQFSVRHFIKGVTSFAQGQLKASVGQWSLESRLRVHAYGSYRPAKEEVGFYGPQFLRYPWGGTFTEMNPMPALEFSEIRDYAEYESFQTFENAPFGGAYSVTLGNQRLNFTIPSQLSAKARVLFLIPEVTLGEGGTISKISWSFQLGNGEKVENPSGLMAKDVYGANTIILSGRGPACSAEGGSGVLDTIGASDGLESGTHCGLKWNDVRTLMFRYKDVFGNSYEVEYLNNGY